MAMGQVIRACVLAAATFSTAVTSGAPAPQPRDRARAGLARSGLAGRWALEVEHAPPLDDRHFSLSADGRYAPAAGRGGTWHYDEKESRLTINVHWDSFSNAVHFWIGRRRDGGRTLEGRFRHDATGHHGTFTMSSRPERGR
jgi:hypothetical protein